MKQEGVFYALWKAIEGAMSKVVRRRLTERGQAKSRDVNISFYQAFSVW